MLPDIQGLRAVAVLLVLFFHLFPEIVPGGYVGVDVFFVISGYLMTGILLRDYEKTGAVDFAGFFARRIRRLLPAAAVVIVCVAVAAPLLPSTRWTLTSHEILASSFFVENWLLASRAVDYLARDEAPGILQHYWSLGVEGQFYVIWPFVLALAFLGARRQGRSARTAGALAIAFVIICFVPLSAWLTYVNPARAYFATEVRVWEFAIGGLVAALSLRERGLPRPLTYLGLLAVLSSGLLYRQDMLFPGWVALLPCLGAAALIASSQKTAVSPALSSRPAVFIGDISYSVYLWHWPLIVFWEAASPNTYGVPAKLGIVALSAILATVSKLLIEDPMRQKRTFSWVQQSLVSGAAIAGLAAATAIIPLNLLVRAGVASASLAANAEYYPGAAVLTGDATLVDNPPPYAPKPALAKKDYPIANRDGCQVYQDATELKACDYGPPNGRPHFVLVGDSHAAQFSNAFKIAAEKNGWHYTHMTKAQCPFMEQSIRYGRNSVPYENCDLWNKQALQRIYAVEPDYVIIAQTWRYMAVGAANMDESQKLMEAGIERRFRDLLSHGIKVIVMKDTPFFKIIAADCLAAGRSDCDRPRKDVAQEKEPLTTAAKKLGLPVIDLTDAICGPTTCRAVVGNVLAWRDSNHLTATYVKTLAPMLAKQMKIIFARDPAVAVN